MNLKINKEKILLFTNELNVMLKSGITFSKSLEILASQENNKNFRGILLKVQKNISQGKGIFESFRNFENIFSLNFLQFLKIGEITGTLNERFENIIENLEFEINNKKKVWGILIYPIIVIALTLCVVSFLLLFILPNFILIFKENNLELPKITKILLFISENFLFILLMISIFLIFTFFLFRYINQNKTRRTKKDKFFLFIPFLGEIMKLNIAINLYYSLSILLSSGISLIDSIDIMYKNTNNYYVKENLLKVRKSINLGNNISISLKNLDIFTERFYMLIVSGEESGYLSENLFQISKILKQDFDYRVKKYLSFLEPLAMLILGLIIAFIVVAIYLPIFSVGDIY